MKKILLFILSLGLLSLTTQAQDTTQPSHRQDQVNTSSELGNIFDVYVSGGIEYSTRQPLTVLRAGLRVGPVTLVGWKGKNRLYEPTVTIQGIETAINSRLYGGALTVYVLNRKLKLGPTVGFTNSRLVTNVNSLPEANSVMDELENMLVAQKIDEQAVSFSTYFVGLNLELKLTDYLRLTSSVSVAKVDTEILGDDQELVREHAGDTIEYLGTGNIFGTQLRAFLGIRISLLDIVDSIR